MFSNLPILYKIFIVIIIICILYIIIYGIIRLNEYNKCMNNAKNAGIGVTTKCTFSFNPLITTQS